MTENDGKRKAAFGPSQRKEREWCFDRGTHSVRALRLRLEIILQSFEKAIKHHALKTHFHIPAMLIKLGTWSQQGTESIKWSLYVACVEPRQYY